MGSCGVDFGTSNSAVALPSGEILRIDPPARDARLFRSVTLGVREMACRLNNDAASFEKAADNLRRAAQIQMSAEQLRLVVEAEGQRVIRLQQAGAIPTAFTARDFSDEIVATRSTAAAKARASTSITLSLPFGITRS